MCFYLKRTTNHKHIYKLNIKTCILIETIQKGQIIMNQLNSNKSLFTDPQSGDASSQQQQQQTTMVSEWKLIYTFLTNKLHYSRTAHIILLMYKTKTRKENGRRFLQKNGNSVEKANTNNSNNNNNYCYCMEHRRQY